MTAPLPILVGGEALYDFISTEPGKGLGDSTTFEKRPGGSPFNIAVAAARMGAPVAFIGKFGVDQFGKALVRFLQGEAIRTEYLVREEGTRTTLAFVAVDHEGKVDFSFYRDNAADTSLTAAELTKIAPEEFALFHCGGIVLAQEPTASAYFSLAERFFQAGVPVTLDPTIRRSLIADEASYLAFLRRLIELVSVLKVSDEELFFLSGANSIAAAWKNLPLRAQTLVILTLGPAGAEVYRDGELLVKVPGFAVEVVETTGCGDSFMGAMLAQLGGRSNAELAAIRASEIEPMARLANAAAAIVATRYGAASANPTRQEVEEFVAGRR
jgi:fructokinase